MKINLDEQETVITFDAKKGEWAFYSCVPAHIRLFSENPLITTDNLEVLTTWEGKPTSIRFTLENDWINTKGFLKKRRVKRTPSIKQLKALEKGRGKRFVNTVEWH